MKLELAGFELAELRHEDGIREQFHRLDHATQTLGRDDMNHRALMTGDGDKGAGLGRPHGRGRGALEFLDAVCILHAEKVYIGRGPVNPAQGQS